MSNETVQQRAGEETSRIHPLGNRVRTRVDGNPFTDPKHTNSTTKNKLKGMGKKTETKEREHMKTYRDLKPKMKLKPRKRKVENLNGGQTKACSEISTELHSNLRGLILGCSRKTQPLPVFRSTMCWGFGSRWHHWVCTQVKKNIKKQKHANDEKICWAADDIKKGGLVFHSADSGNQSQCWWLRLNPPPPCCGLTWTIDFCGRGLQHTSAWFAQVKCFKTIC